MSTNITPAKPKQHGGFRTENTTTTKKEAAKAKTEEGERAKTRKRGMKSQERPSCGKSADQPMHLTKKYASARLRKKKGGRSPQGRAAKQRRETRAKPARSPAGNSHVKDRFVLIAPSLVELVDVFVRSFKDIYINLFNLMGIQIYLSGIMSIKSEC